MLTIEPSQPVMKKCCMRVLMSSIGSSLQRGISNRTHGRIGMALNVIFLFCAIVTVKKPFSLPASLSLKRSVEPL